MPQTAPGRRAQTRQGLDYAAAAALIHGGYQPTGDPACQCRQARSAHGGTRHTGAAPGCERYRRDPVETLADQMLAAAANPLRDAASWLARTQRPKGLGASDVAACPRSLMYRERPPAGFVPDPVHHDEATIGTALDRLIGQAQAAMYPWMRFQGAVSIPGLTERDSHFDRYDPLLGVITDGKSASDWMWNQVAFGPWPGHVAQVLVYGCALTGAGELVVTCRLEYLHRGTGDLRVHEWPYRHDQGLLAVGMLRALAAMLDSGEELPRGRRGPTDPICATRCEGRTHCWSLDKAAETGRTPESLTLLGEDPAADPETAAWVIRTARDAGKAMSEAKAAYEAARAALPGLPNGVYGDTKLTDVSRPPSKNLAAWAVLVLDALAEWRATPPGERPAADFGDILTGIPIPRKKQETRFQIERAEGGKP